jgi:hypothetical protein
MTLRRHRLDRPRPRKTFEQRHFSEMVTLNRILLKVEHALGLCPRHWALAVAWTHVLHSVHLVETECAVPARDNVPRCDGGNLR